MGVGAGLYIYDVVVNISSPGEFLVKIYEWTDEYTGTLIAILCTSPGYQGGV